VNLVSETRWNFLSGRTQILSTKPSVKISLRGIKKAPNHYSVRMMDNAKEIADPVRNVEDLDLYRKILKMQAEVVQLSTRNFELEQQCAGLWEEVSRKRSLKAPSDDDRETAPGFTVSFARRLADKKFHELFAPGRLANLLPVKLSRSRNPVPAAKSNPLPPRFQEYSTSSLLLES